MHRIDERTLVLPCDLVSFDTGAASDLAEFATTMAPAKIVDRGYRLARDRKIAYIRFEGREVTAKALGASDIYELSAVFPPTDAVELWPTLSCSCPFAVQHPQLWCKHRVAFAVLLAAAVDQQPTALMEELTGWDLTDVAGRADVGPAPVDGGGVDDDGLWSDAEPVLNTMLARARAELEAEQRRQERERQRVREERAAQIAAQAQLAAELVDVRVFDVAAQMRRFESIRPCPVPVTYPGS